MTPGLAWRLRAADGRLLRSRYAFVVRQPYYMARAPGDKTCWPPDLILYPYVKQWLRRLVGRDSHRTGQFHRTCLRGRCARGRARSPPTETGECHEEEELRCAAAERRADPRRIDADVRDVECAAAARRLISDRRLNPPRDECRKGDFAFSGGGGRVSERCDVIVRGESYR
jgi:hypothetical protein